MKKNQKIKMTVDVLEKEMSVLSSMEILKILGGEGDDPPLGGGYCTFNTLEEISKKFDGGIEAQTWLKNYSNQNGVDGFSFDSQGKVTGTFIRGYSLILTLQELTNLTSEATNRSGFSIAVKCPPLGITSHFTTL